MPLARVRPIADAFLYFLHSYQLLHLNYHLFADVVPRDNGAEIAQRLSCRPAPAPQLFFKLKHVVGQGACCHWMGLLS